MARLIDADELKKSMNYNGACGICLRYVDSADTIPAIPVEWLRERYLDARDASLSYSAGEVLEAWAKQEAK